MTNSEILNNILSDDNSAISREWVEKIRTDYPYFIVPALLYVARNKKSMSQEDKDNLISYLALNVPDRKELAQIINDDLSRYTSFYPEPQPMATPDTNSTIDTFLNKFGNSNDKELEAIENIIFNPTPEYGLTMANEENVNKNEKKDKQDSLIDTFLQKNPVNQNTRPAAETDTVNDAEKEDDNILPPPIPATEPTEAGTGITETPPAITPKHTAESDIIPDENQSLSESLAKVYIKQKKYAKAYDILLSVSRQDTSHSPYIEDQLRFLLKVMKATNTLPSRQ